ncbi:MAG: tetrameric acyl-CoA thioesterase [Xanthomonadaceae bacterium]|nr:tetrameric acyl-CoA thioesterase [Xanthomonadaceae bacterium]
MAAAKPASLRAKAADLLSSLLYRNATVFRLRMNLYPPYLGAGIRVTRVSADFREIDVELRRSPGNANAFGTHFGGSLYAMVDPFYCLQFFAGLGSGYLVWDKAAKIEFVRPGKGTVRARFRISEADIQAARDATATGGKYLPVFHVDVLDAGGAVVAKVEKELYVRRKPDRNKRSGAAPG